MSKKKLKFVDKSVDIIFYMLYSLIVVGREEQKRQKNRKKFFKNAEKNRRGVAQLGSAHGLGPWGWRFKSSHPDH